MLCSNSYRTDNAYETNNGKTHKVAHAGLYGGGGILFFKEIFL